MSEEVRIKNTGLRGVTVADSKVSFINAEEGVLIYRGYRVEELADRSGYPETVWLLLTGHLPAGEELAAFNTALATRRALPGYLLDSLAAWPSTARPMDVLQASAALLALDDADAERAEKGAMLDKATGLIARFPTIIAAWHRIRQGLAPVEPDPGLKHATNFLYMLTGHRPDEATARDLDVCLVLHADHTFNASTFSCRQVVSTRAHIYAGVAAGMGALSGSLHGGANARVMEMLLSLEGEEDIEGWVKARLDAHEKIMGLGHAVYKTEDPRSRYLHAMGERLGKETGQRWYEISARIEAAAAAEFQARGRTALKPNVDFNSAPVYYVMGIPIDLMTPVFAMSRVAGWSSHIMEEVLGEADTKPKLYRPSAGYVGHYCGLMGCRYDDIDARNG